MIPAEQEIMDIALSLLWETYLELSPQPTGYRSRGAADRAFARLMDNYDITVKSGWDAKQRLAAVALKAQTNGSKE